MTFVDDRRVFATERADMFIGAAGAWITLMRVAVAIKAYPYWVTGGVR